MARYRGNFTVAANYEPLKAAPFDARALVETKADLTAATTWQQSDGSLWIYSGMIVSVNSDVNAENNGAYVLLDAKNYTLEDSWRKLADTVSIEDLQKQIDEIDVGNGSGADIEVGSKDQLPTVGMSGVTYFVRNTQTIYRWDVDAKDYISYGGGSADLDNINMIYGGNANV